MGRLWLAALPARLAAAIVDIRRTLEYWQCITTVATTAATTAAAAAASTYVRAPDLHVDRYIAQLLLAS